MNYLLDANTLIAIADTEHSRHPLAFSWFSSLGTNQAATCPTVENALLRYLVRIGVKSQGAWDMAQSIKGNRRVEFVKEASSMALPSLTGVSGHRQITDVYLCQVAALADRRLATFDQGLCQFRPKVTTNLALLMP